MITGQIKNQLYVIKLFLTAERNAAKRNFLKIMLTKTGGIRYLKHKLNIIIHIKKKVMKDDIDGLAM